MRALDFAFKSLELVEDEETRRLRSKSSLLAIFWWPMFAPLGLLDLLVIVGGGGGGMAKPCLGSVMGCWLLLVLAFAMGRVKRPGKPSSYLV